MRNGHTVHYRTENDVKQSCCCFRLGKSKEVELMGTREIKRDKHGPDNIIYINILNKIVPEKIINLTS